MAEEIISYNRLAPYIEERGKQLLQSTFGDSAATIQPGESQADFQARKLGRAGVAQQIPGYEFAGFTPEQQQAFGLASQNVGGYAPASTGSCFSNTGTRCSTTTS